MLIVTILFLISGLIYNMWYINWIVYPIGGIMCGIVGTIFNKEQQKEIEMKTLKIIVSIFSNV